MLAWKFSLAYHRPAYTLNPTNVDEYCDYARLTGIRGLYRSPHSHVLNPKAVAEAHAESMGKRVEDCNFIVAHIDGGRSLCPYPNRQRAGSGAAGLY